jgi:hypothetical protein
MKEKLKSLSGNRRGTCKTGNEGIFAKPKPASTGTTPSAKPLFGITETCTPGDPIASSPDQY